jgi:hypothetical protein
VIISVIDSSGYFHQCSARIDAGFHCKGIKVLNKKEIIGVFFLHFGVVRGIQSDWIGCEALMGIAVAFFIGNQKILPVLQAPGDKLQSDANQNNKCAF